MDGQQQAEAAAALDEAFPKQSESQREVDFADLPSMWSSQANRLGDSPALIDEHHEPAVRMTFGELHGSMTRFAAGLASLGLARGDRVSLFSENGARWLIADQASMMLGAANALRGVTSPAEELTYIMRNSESAALIVQDEKTLSIVIEQLRKEAASDADGQSASILSGLKFVVVLWGGAGERASDRTIAPGIPCLTFDEVSEMGAGSPESQAAVSRASESRRPQDIASIIYTSGTTGNPKGVMLSHANLMYQVTHLHNAIGLTEGSNTLVLLPPWHVYQLTTSYYSYSCGVTSRYSNVKHFPKDIAAHGTDYLVAVPLVIESLYKKVMLQMKAFSSAKRALVGLFFAASTAYVKAMRVVQGRCLEFANAPPSKAAMAWSWLTSALLKPIHALATALVYAQIRAKVNIRGTIISGGGALADYLEDFYEVVGIEIINGWGLTESSPVIAARTATTGSHVFDNVRGTMGKPLPGLQVKVVDPETLEEVEAGEKGLLLAQGPTIFGGYMNSDEQTAKAFRYGAGWFDTGDLGYRVPHRAHHTMGDMLVHVGRSKETIVLSNGENVEPGPIESACLASPYVAQIVVLGQDQKALGALVVLDAEAAADAGLGAEEAVALLKREVKERNAARPFYKTHEAVRHFAVLAEPLTFEDGFLTRTMKVRRHVVEERYRDQIAAMFKR